MASSEALLETLVSFARTLARSYEITDALHDLSARASGVLDISGAGVSLIEEGRLRFVTADREQLAAVEQVQERVQAGPCVTAAHRLEVVAVGDLRSAKGRWPDYSRAAVSLGILGVASIPMHVDATAIGALNLYHAAPHDWEDEELRVGGVLAAVATGYVVNASKLEQQRRIAEQLERALESRVVIEQAKGIVAADRAVSIDEAFRVLRRHANDHNANLHRVAEAVVQFGLRPSVRGGVSGRRAHHRHGR